MADERERGSPPQGGGLNERALEPATDERLSGTGGAAGGGTRAGAGDPAGDQADKGGRPPEREDIGARDRKLVGAAVGTGLAQREAAEAAALGPQDGRSSGPDRSLGEVPGAGASGEPGSGTRGDKSGLGGGGPAGQHGGTGPQGSASPGGDRRG